MSLNNSSRMLRNEASNKCKHFYDVRKSNSAFLNYCVQTTVYYQAENLQYVTFSTSLHKKNKLLISRFPKIIMALFALT